MRIVLDASVAIKIYAEENDSPAALTWLEGAHRFEVPDIFLVEVTQALLRLERADFLTSGDVGAATQELQSRTEAPHGSGQLLGRALDLARRLDHGLHDCMYLALADQLSCPFLTADLRLTRKLAERPVHIRLLSLTETP